jgi:Ca2+-binding RTX toxin-like protein
VDGGTGIDFYDALGSVAVLVNLDSVDRNFGPFSGQKIDALSAKIGVDVDAITGFEDVRGGSQGDFIHGNSAANQLQGGSGNDFLFGFTGNDELLGQNGDDLLLGGAGVDKLTGGTNIDRFAFTSKTDSGLTKATRDVITDFVDGTDLIDFSFLDGNSTNGIGIDDFSNAIVVNGNFSGSAGQIRVFQTITGWIVETNSNNDFVADLSIEVLDESHLITWTSGNFLL